MMSLEKRVRRLYNKFGQQKPMGESAPGTQKPHYFLLRSFMGENDLLIILNTKRCRYQCHFCQLPTKSSKNWIAGEDILAQFEYVLCEMKHALSILDRVTLSNEGSILDTGTLPMEILLIIAKCVNVLRRVRTIVLETRLEFVEPDVIRQLKEAAPGVTVNILTGFETQNPYIRDTILFKKEPIELFLTGLDKVAESKSSLTSYVLYKPSPIMSDDEAFVEAEETINYLVDQCNRRDIPLTVRLNPMYSAKESKWAELAHATPNYNPPRLTDVMRLAEKEAQKGVRIYIGLSTEGLNEPEGKYICREDYSPHLIKPIILFNNGKISRFEWKSLVG